MELQQHLPLAVLKPSCSNVSITKISGVLQQHLPLAVLKQNCFEMDGNHHHYQTIAIALTACGIETIKICQYIQSLYIAIALTACGIETYQFTSWIADNPYFLWTLQQHLPLAVLKLRRDRFVSSRLNHCNSTYRLRY